MFKIGFGIREVPTYLFYFIRKVGCKMENKSLNLTNDKELKITSVELVDIINQFRQLESKKTDKKYVELQHDNFIKKIRKEIEVLESVGILTRLNILIQKEKQDHAMNLIVMEC